MLRAFEKGLNFPGKDEIRLEHLLFLFFFFSSLRVLSLYFLSFLHLVK